MATSSPGTSAGMPPPSTPARGPRPNRSRRPSPSVASGGAALQRAHGRRAGQQPSARGARRTARPRARPGQGGGALGLRLTGHRRRADAQVARIASARAGMGSEWPGGERRDGRSVLENGGFGPLTRPDAPKRAPMRSFHLQKPSWRPPQAGDARGSARGSHDQFGITSTLYTLKSRI